MIDGILQCDRLLLSRAITLIESKLPSDRPLALEVLNGIKQATGNAIRLGITGPPGVGKSTFIEAFGQLLIAEGNKVAVLTIDPSSSRQHGSILGDKTRMEVLARHPMAYVRPSPSGNALGGITTRTRETMFLCEAAGFNHIIIETVGVGQSETLVRGVVDFFLLLILAGSGDELQGIKRGIMEMADAIAITKADGDNTQAAKLARLEYQNALGLLPRQYPNWTPPVILSSAISNLGLPEINQTINRFIALMKNSGHFQQLRAQQELIALNDGLREAILNRFFSQPNIADQIKEAETKILNAEWDAARAVRELLGGGNG